ncbi:MAG TPA: tetratricopeptide repeat protein, partial [Pyrinomonadaceae bacterium]
MRSSAAKLSAFALSLFLVLFLSADGARAQSPAQSERAEAMRLFEANNFVAALPLLEKAALASPNDPVILSRLGFAIYAASTTVTDAATRQAARARARGVLLKSQAAGDDSNLTKIALAALSRDDVAAIPFSNMKAADDEIRKGESAFVSGNLDEALEAYKRALALDPQLYEAALYAGDVEFKKAYQSKDERFRQQHFDQAGIWFAKAIAIDQNRETAHRYWGDALDSQGKTDEARDRFVEAIIAEPYTRTSYVGLTQWADRHNVSMGHPKIEVPANVNAKKPGEINITLEDSGLKAQDND